MVILSLLYSLSVSFHSYHLSMRIMRTLLILSSQLVRSCTLTLLYTHTTELTLSKHFPTGWLWSFHLNNIIFLYLLILFFIIFIYSLTTSKPIPQGLLLLFYLNVEQLWQHCHIILYDQTTDFYFTLWVFHLFNKWPTTCMQCIDLCHRVTLTWPMGACHWFWSAQRGNNSRRSVTQTRFLSHSLNLLYLMYGTTLS